MSDDDHACRRCGAFGSFGTRGPGGVRLWWCRDHLPADFWDVKLRAEGKLPARQCEEPAPRQAPVKKAVQGRLL